MKKLTIGQIKREANQYNRKEEYDLNNEYKIEFYPLFAYEKIEQLIEEYQRDLLYAEENGINLISSDHFVYKYIVFLAIKYFTNLGDDISDKVEDKILILKHLNDTGYLRQIANEVFMASEVGKIFDYMSDIQASSQMLQEVNEKAMDKVGELEFQYKDLLDELDKNLNEVNTEIKEKESELKH